MTKIAKSCYHDIMNVSLTPALERLVQRKVDSGLYTSASEVIREALRFLEDDNRLYQAKLDSLRKDIAVGIKQADHGELISGKQAFSKVRSRNRSR